MGILGLYALILSFLYSFLFLVSMDYVVCIDQSHADLAVAELERSLHATVTPLQDKFFRLRLDSSDSMFSHLALTRYVYEVIDSGSFEDINWKSACAGEYYLKVHGVADVITVQDKVFTQVDAKVDSTTTNTLHYFPAQHLVTRLVYERKEHFGSRKAHNLPGHHPTTMDPKVARAMINLTGTDSFHDPCCGSGGIVIEGVLAGKHATGADIMQPMVNRAQANAEFLGVKAQFVVADVLADTALYDALVTDLPYGRNATLSADKEQFYTDFFMHAQELTQVLIVGTNVDVATYVKDTRWNIQRTFDIYVHKSLTRKITILEH
jgi:tRNA G10  N-methylase Trm11